MNRFLLLLVPLTVWGTAAAQQPVIRPFDVGANAYVNGMTSNGKWVTYQLQSGEQIPLDIQVLNTSTGNFEKYTPAKFIDYNGKEQAFQIDSYSYVTGISDDGKTIIGSVDGTPGYFTVDDLTWHGLSMGDRYANRNFVGAAYAITPDGRTIAGWFTEGSSMTSFRSGLWIEGELQELPYLPTYEDMYEEGVISQEIYEEYQGKTPNYSFRQLSDDGRTVAFGINHNQPGWGCCYAVYDLDTQTYEFMLAPREMGQSFTESAIISPNGKWVTGTVVFLEGELEDVDAVYLYNRDTHEMQLFYETADRDILVDAVDNNGVIYGATPASNPLRNTVVRSEGLWVDLAKTLQQKYGVNWSESSQFDQTGYPVAITADCKTMLLQAEFRGGACVLTLPETFSEAALGVSLLTDYAISPAEGSKFAHLKDVMVRFGYQAEPTGNAMPYATDAQGNKIATAEGMQAASSQGLVYTISFPETLLAADETYTVTIPSGTFRVPGTEMYNPEIAIQYVGRANVPVAPTKVTPEEGSYVNELSFNSPITIAFDAPLTLSTAVQPALYEDGNPVPLCRMSAAISGNMLAIYPAAARKLAKDKNYTVAVPAELVADLGKAGKSEAFEIHYQGTYVPTSTQVGNYLFFDDIAEPNASLNNFLLYDGDRLTPVDEMAAVGFDNANTPWNFSVRDDAAYDYAAMSHSMYTEQGRSDDWMMIPRLAITNPSYFLSFQAQGYKEGANDQLSIYIWEYDDVIGSLDADMIAKCRAEAKLLDRVTVVPGLHDGTLEGSWTSYEYPLAEYAGKNIYIAFVNENEGASGIFMDNIGVEYRGDFSLSVTTLQNVVKAASTPLSGTVTINNEGTFDTLYVKAEAEGYSSEITYTGMGLTKGQSRQFELPEPLPLKEGKNNPYKLTVSLDGTQQVFQGSVADHAFETNRRVLVEEGTGMWCGNCPTGEVAIEYLEETMPDNVAVISVHNQDALAFVEYDQFLALGAYPNGRVNRMGSIYHPLYPDEQTGDYVLTSPEGDQSFMDAVLSELEKTAEAEISIVDPVYYSADKVVNIPVSVKFSLDQTGKPYFVFTAILEDALTGWQTNYFVGSSSEILSWWAGQDKKVLWEYKNVARGIDESFFGVSGRIPSEIEAGVEYRSDRKILLPQSVIEPENMHFVVALIDATNGLVVNSDVCRVFTDDPTPGGSSVREVSANQHRPAVRVAGGRIYADGSDDLEIYSMAGMRLRNEGLQRGIYIVRAVTADGTPWTGRVSVR